MLTRATLSDSHDEEWRRSAARDAQRGDDTQVVGRGGDDVKDREIIPRAAWQRPGSSCEGGRVHQGDIACRWRAVHRLISSRSGSCMHHEHACIMRHHEASMKLHCANIFESHQSDNSQEYDAIAHI